MRSQTRPADATSGGEGGKDRQEEEAFRKEVQSSESGQGEICSKVQEREKATPTSEACSEEDENEEEGGSKAPFE
jgi:hypothetical protein